MTIALKPTAHGPPRSLCLNNLVMVAGTQSHCLENHRGTYVLCEQDKALSPVVQERMAGRCNRAVRLNSGQSPFISQPKRLTNLILGM
jgi:hypothetical protein